MLKYLPSVIITEVKKSKMGEVSVCMSILQHICPVYLTVMFLKTDMSSVDLV